MIPINEPAFWVGFLIVTIVYPLIVHIQKKEEKAKEQYREIKRADALSRLREINLNRQELNEDLNEINRLISKIAQQLTDKDSIETIELPDGITYQVMKGDNHDI